MVSPHTIAARLQSRGYRVDAFRGVYTAPCPCCQTKDEAPPWFLTFETYRQGTWLRCSTGCEKNWVYSLIGISRGPKKDLKPCTATVFCHPPPPPVEEPPGGYAAERRRQRRRERANPYDYT
jgi:hypothetical protein